MTGNISQFRYRIGDIIKICNGPYKEYIIYPGFPDGCNNYISKESVVVERHPFSEGFGAAL
jgi:hypothetical protein